MIIALFSGGIDSWACLNWALSHYGINNVQPLYVDFGQVYAFEEIYAAQKLCTHLGCIPLQVVDMRGFLVEDLSSGHIPLRNTLLLMAAALLEDATGVVFGMLKGDSSEDKNMSYIRIMTALFDSQFKASIYRKETRPFKIIVPFASYTKTQVVAWVKKHTLDVGISKTIGCYSSYSIPCGKCMSCFNRWVALTNNDCCNEIYVSHPFTWMCANIAARKQTKLDNPRMFSFKQMWMKRTWFFESLRAMNTYSRKNHNMNIVSYLRNMQCI